MKSGGVHRAPFVLVKKPIRSTYLVKTADFVACHKQEYVNLYDMYSELNKGGTFLLNTEWPVDELDKHLPAAMKKYFAENDIKFYVINGTDIAREIALGNRVNSVLQASIL